MKRKNNLARLVLAGAVALVLTLLMVGGEVQARIAFASKRNGNLEIYVMDPDGANPRNLTIIAIMTRVPHGLPMASALSFLPNEMGTGKST